MAHTQTHFDYPFIAANDFRVLLYRVVDYAGDLAAANGFNAMGVVQSQPNSGQHGSALRYGIGKAYAGAVITTPGFPLTTAASGFVVAATSGANIIGRFIQPGRTTGAACASGDLVTALFNFGTFRDIGASSGYA